MHVNAFKEVDLSKEMDSLLDPPMQSLIQDLHYSRLVKPQ
jgi:hypothetical protein